MSKSILVQARLGGNPITYATLDRNTLRICKHCGHYENDHYVERLPEPLAVWATPDAMPPPPICWGSAPTGPNGARIMRVGHLHICGCMRFEPADAPKHPEERQGGFLNMCDEPECIAWTGTGFIIVL